MKIINVRPPKIAVALLALSVILHVILPPYIRRDFPMPYLGSSLIFAGLGVMIWAWKLFQDSRTPICPTTEPTTLVTRGPYRFSRNPMYFGIVVALLGIALFAGSTPFFIPPVAFFLVVNNVFIPYEETNLRRIFGEEYATFKSKVRRWL